MAAINDAHTCGTRHDVDVCPQQQAYALRRVNTLIGSQLPADERNLILDMERSDSGWLTVLGAAGVIVGIFVLTAGFTNKGRPGPIPASHSPWLPRSSPSRPYVFWSRQRPTASGAACCPATAGCSTRLGRCTSSGGWRPASSPSGPVRPAGLVTTSPAGVGRAARRLQPR
ncbi:hypothetical protein NKG94_47990 [Micromonospora sp. M12]